MIYFPLNIADSLAFVLFLTAWISYTFCAKYRAKRSYTLSSLMRRHREQWMREMLRRENRISDATIIGNLERVVIFLPPPPFLFWLARQRLDSTARHPVGDCRALRARIQFQGPAIAAGKLTTENKNH